MLIPYNAEKTKRLRSDTKPWARRGLEQSLYSQFGFLLVVTALKGFSYPPPQEHKPKWDPGEELRTVEKGFTAQNHGTQPHDPHQPQKGFVYSFTLTRSGQKAHTDRPWALHALQRWVTWCLRKLGICYQYVKPKDFT